MHLSMCVGQDVMFMLFALPILCSKSLYCIVKEVTLTYICVLVERDQKYEHVQLESVLWDV